MATNNRLKGLMGRAFSISFCTALTLLATGSLHATGISNNIWTSGGVLGNSGQYDSNNNSPAVANTVGGTPWTIFDNFTTPTSSLAWIVTQFDFTDYLNNAPSLHAGAVKSVTWSIWSGDPLTTNGTLVATGSGTPSAVLNANGTYTFTVTGLNVGLSPNTKYYLGTNNLVTQDPGSVSSTTTQRALAGPPPSPEVGSTFWEQSNGSVNGKSWTSISSTTYTTNNYTAFDIGGTLTPEPGTWTLMSLALGGLFFVRRRWTA